MLLTKSAYEKSEISNYNNEIIVDTINAKFKQSCNALNIPYPKNIRIRILIASITLITIIKAQSEIIPILNALLGQELIMSMS